jgi:hypothetical protein
MLTGFNWGASSQPGFLIETDIYVTDGNPVNRRNIARISGTAAANREFAGLQTFPCRCHCSEANSYTYASTMQPAAPVSLGPLVSRSMDFLRRIASRCELYMGTGATRRTFSIVAHPRDWRRFSGSKWKDSPGPCLKLIFSSFLSRQASLAFLFCLFFKTTLRYRSVLILQHFRLFELMLRCCASHSEVSFFTRPRIRSRTPFPGRLSNRFRICRG